MLPGEFKSHPDESSNISMVTSVLESFGESEAQAIIQ